jgi:hypothetical protein
MHDVSRQYLYALLAGRWDVITRSALSDDAWTHLERLAQQQGVAALIYHLLATADMLTHVPPQTVERLRTVYYHTLAHNTMLYRDLAAVLATIRALPTEQQIPVVVLKGAALASTMYPSLAVRPMVDIDILLPQHYLSPVVQALHQQGYAAPMPDILPSFHQRYHRHVSVCGKQSTIELHWSLIAGRGDWRAVSLQWFWQQTTSWAVPQSLTQTTSGQQQAPEALQLTPTAHVLYLAAHLMLQHGGGQMRVIWLYDIHLLITRAADQIDWEELMTQAQAYRWTAALHAALQAAQDNLGTVVPPDVLPQLAATHDTRAARMVRQLAKPVHTRTAFFYNELLTMNWATRLALTRSYLLPTRAYLRWRYPLDLPAWLWPLYYPYRWYDLARDGAQTIATMIRRKLQRQQ